MKEDINKSVLSSNEISLEQESENFLRPQAFEDFPGQDDVKKKLQVFISAARERGDSLDHTLLYGPPGLGKTTLARIIANSLEVPFVSTSGPAIRKKGDLAAILTGLQNSSVLFIDEIHRLSYDIEEYLYSAMEDFFIDIVTGEGIGAQSIRFNLAPFTLVGATTRTGLLQSPFRDRFGIIERLDFYDNDSLATIIKRSSSLLKVKINEEAAREVAQRGRGTPRIVNRLLKRIRDYAQVHKKEEVDKDLASYALDELGVNKYGLHSMDMKILQTLEESGSPMGIDSLASSLQEDAGTIEDFYEPYLIRLAYIQKTTKGRIITAKGQSVLKSL